MSSSKNTGRAQTPSDNSKTSVPPEFVPDEDGAKPQVAGPRSYGNVSGSLSVQHVDMWPDKNRYDHNTSAYATNILVIRRGKEFCIRVTFNRPVAQGDLFQVEFRIGSNPVSTQGTLVTVDFPSRQGSRWSGYALEPHDGATVTLCITPAADAIVGRFETYVTTRVNGGTTYSPRDASTDIYMLFNAWCTEDEVFIPSEGERMEYVMNDYGMIYQGEADAVGSRPWVYGQFEEGILEACIYIMDKSHIPLSDRNQAIKVARMGSAMLNTQDDQGMLVGRWDGEYNLGTAPTLWTGSTRIMLKYFNSGGTPVSYAQCWVYAGVFNTFLRCLGIGSRVITNFCSAHDSSGNLTTDLIFLASGGPDRRNTRDSVWNYHCWNELNLVRRDLPKGMGGWQVCDATPQETSDGYFRCGPCSVSSIKSGTICHPYDAPFVFAEVNSHLVFLKRDKYGTLTPYHVDKTHVGKLILTKAVGSDRAENITHTYKHPEGSAADEATMEAAEGYGCGGLQYDMPEVEVDAVMSVHGTAQLGHDFTIAVVFRNMGGFRREIQAKLTGSVIYYTGVPIAQFMDQRFVANVDAFTTERVLLNVSAQKYLPVLHSEPNLEFILTGKTMDALDVTAMKVVVLQPPAVNIKVTGEPLVGEEMYVTVDFANPFDYDMENIDIGMEAPGLMTSKDKQYSKISPKGTISWMESFRPMRAGDRYIAVALDCKSLHHVSGGMHVFIHERAQDGGQQRAEYVGPEDHGQWEGGAK